MLRKILLAYRLISLFSYSLLYNYLLDDARKNYYCATKNAGPKTCVSSDKVKVGGPSRVRTYDQPVMSRRLYH